MRASLSRGFDLAVASAAFLALLPVLAGAAAAAFLSSPGPAFFRQARVGLNGKTFMILKVRSMRSERGAPITAADDPRITAVGRVLRRLKLDELPQLVNVVLGDMSLVGPRPEVPELVAGYSREDRAVLTVRPGLVDPATLELRDEEEILAGRDDPLGYYREVLLPRKLALSRDYLARATFTSDLAILARGVAQVLATRRGGRR